VLIHVVTTKGKGFAPAERNPTAWHGVGPFDVSSALTGTGVSSKDGSGTPPKTWSDVFGDAMIEAARKDDRVCAVVAAMKDGTGLAEFAKEFPDRFFDVGICEEMAVTFAAGLAKSGMKPVVAIYSTFLQRSIGQIQHDVCLQKLPVVFAVDRAGCVGADGFTHHGMYDIALLKPLAGMKVLAPTCADELKGALASALLDSSPVAIRYPRGVAPQKKDVECSASPDCKVRILAVGDQVGKAQKVKELLASGAIAAEVVPVMNVKPFDFRISRDALLVSIENAALCGGFGEGIGADLKFGWPDEAVCHGTVDELEREHGFDAQSIASTIRQKLAEK
jgi:1-deoxy-D-xylulose-5-phosphate synthase